MELRKASCFILHARDEHVSVMLHLKYLQDASACQNKASTSSFLKALCIFLLLHAELRSKYYEVHVRVKTYKSFFLLSYKIHFCQDNSFYLQLSDIFKMICNNRGCYGKLEQ